MINIHKGLLNIPLLYRWSIHVELIDFEPTDITNTHKNLIFSIFLEILKSIKIYFLQLLQRVTRVLLIQC